MIVMRENVPTVILSPSVNVLSGFFNDVKDDCKTFLAKKEGDEYVIELKAPLSDDLIDEITEKFEDVLENRLKIRQIAILVGIFMPMIAICAIISNYIHIPPTAALFILLGLSLFAGHRLNEKLNEWYSKQLNAINGVKRYIYMSFNAMCIDELEEWSKLYRDQAATVNSLNQNLKIFQQANQTIHIRYSDLAQRVSKYTLDEHISYCRLKYPSPDDYEVEGSTMVH